MGSYEDMLRQKMGQPVDDMAQQMGQSADQGVAALQQKLQALQSMGSGGTSPQQLPPQAGMPPQGAPQPPQGPMPMPNQAQQQAAIGNGEMWQRIKAHDDAMKAQMAQQDSQNAQQAAQFNPAQYKDYNSGAAGASSAFPKIAQMIAKGMKQNKQDDADQASLEKDMNKQQSPDDYRASLAGKGPVEATPDVMKKLGYGSDDEDEEK